MAFCGDTFRIYYIAKGYQPSLTDVRMVVYKPDGVKQGVYLLDELNLGDGRGIYYYDYTDSDIEGSYLFVINSVSYNRKDARQVFFYDRNATGWTETEKRQIRDALGVTGDKVTAIGGQLQTAAENIEFIKQIEGGKWHITGTQMIFYKSDNVTEIARFDLFDQSGSPSATNVYKRERV